MVIRTHTHPPPRVVGSDGPIPVDFAVRMYVDRARCGAILIRGGPGSDLTAAADHLLEAFQGRPDVRVSDKQLANTDPYFNLKGWAIDVGCPLAGRVYTAVLDLAPWSTDEIIEYVLQTFPQKAKSILDRIMPTPDPSLEGNPRVWRTAIEILANLDRIKSPSEALDEFLRVRIGDRPGVENEALFHLQTGARHGTWPRGSDYDLGGLKQSDVELLKCPPVLARLALNSVIRTFADPKLASETNLDLPAHLAGAAGGHAAKNSQWRGKVLASLQYPGSASAASAASILSYSRRLVAAADGLAGPQRRPPPWTYVAGARSAWALFLLGRPEPGQPRTDHARQRLIPRRDAHRGSASRSVHEGRSL